MASAQLHNPLAAHGYIYLEELGEVTSNVDGVTSMAATTSHGQAISGSVGQVVIWRGLTPDAEYVLNVVGAAGAGAATTLRWMTSPTATLITGTLLAEGADFACRLFPTLVVKMPPGHTRLGVRQQGTGIVAVSLYRARF